MSYNDNTGTAGREVTVGFGNLRREP